MSTRAVPAELLRDIKTSLQITWDDENTDDRIRGYIQDGMHYLDGKLGEPGDYLSTGTPRTLLKEYVRYARDAALDVFENNYQALILDMQNERKVLRYAACAASARS